MAMLKREETSGAAVGSDLNALLGRGSEFDGKLSFEGTVRIDGRFTGTVVTTDTLVVGEGAHVNAEITCGTLIVHGTVSGNVKASVVVELHPPARVSGSIETVALIVQKGVSFNGQCKMEPPARAGGPLPLK
ncbi:MAG: polymer-forming cytoskeletal protein [Deltaproteobacteria bacterium]